jgi:CNT family concentrative nucleoside transporter
MAWLLSNNKRRIDYRVVLWGVLLQVVLAVIILKTTPGQAVFFYARDFFNRLLSFTDAGSAFLFGNIFRGDPDVARGIGGSSALQLWDPAGNQFINIGIIFAIHVLPTIIFFSALMSAAYHVGIMQKVTQKTAAAMTRFLGVSGAESLSVAANIFVGPTEAVLLIRPYVSALTFSELMLVMTGGFASVAGWIMVAAIRFGVDAGHLMAASVMSAPAALVMAKIIFPETDEPKTKGEIKVHIGKTNANVLDAVATGAVDGLKLVLNIGGMVLVFIALIAMLDFVLLKLGMVFGLDDLSLKKILGYAFAPISLIMGVETADVLDFGYLLGTKISIHELLAFQYLGQLKEQVSPRTFTIATYALSGFANFCSIAIQLGGIGGMAPERKVDLTRLVFKALAAGALASWMTAAIAGVLL